MRLQKSRKIPLKLVFPLLALLILPGCFGRESGDGSSGSGDPTKKIAFYTPVEAEDFFMQIPEEWEVIEQFTSNYPPNTVVAFRNNVKDNDFLANINVVRNEVVEGTLTADYALQMAESLRQQMKNFAELEKTSTTLASPTGPIPSYVFEFQGTNDTATLDRRFIQTYGIKGTKAYIVTGTYDPEDAELAIDQVKKSVRSFGLR